MAKALKSLLIVDAGKNRNHLTSRLRVTGYNVELALGGFQAINMLENNSINLVIIKNDPEDMPAYEIIGLIRTNHTPQSLPVIFLADKMSEERNKMVMDFGANFIFASNLPFNQLLDKIEKLS